MNHLSSRAAEFATFGRNRPHLRSLYRVALAMADEPTDLLLDGGFSVFVPADALSETTVFSIEVSRDALGVGSLFLHPKVAFQAPVHVEVTFDPHDVPDGDVLDNLEFRLNGALVDTRLVGIDEQGLETYELEANTGGLLTITEIAAIPPEPDEGESAVAASAAAAVSGTCALAILPAQSAYFVGPE